MAIEVRRAVIISLGQQGYAVATALEERLQRRHGGVPIVQRMALAQEASLENAAGKIVWVALPPERAAALAQLSSIKTWLPHLDTPDLTCRAGARLAVLDLHDKLGAALRDVLNKHLFNPQSATRMAEHGLKAASPGMKMVDIYIVGNLGEPLTSGMFIDVAYLVKKIAQDLEADRLYFQVNGLFLLPQLLPGWDDMTEDETTRRQAETYAALKELDYYMDKHSYVLQYPNGEAVKFPAHTGPFEPGYCYLVGATNEGIEAVAAHDAVNMTAEWLYHILIAVVHAGLAPDFNFQYYGAGRAIGAYSSIGLASLIQPMRFVQDYCARRLVYDLATTLLPPSQEDLTELSRAEKLERDERARRDFQNSQISLDGMHTRLIGPRDGTDQAFSISPQAYNHLFVFDYRSLETELIEAYNKLQGAGLARLKARMGENRQKEQAQVLERLKVYVRQLFNDDPANAVDRSLNFLDRLLAGGGGVQERLSRVEQDIRALEDKQRRHHKKIKQRRGHYFNAAQTFGDLPMVPALVGTVAFGVVFANTFMVLENTLGYPWEARTIIGTGILAILTVAGSMLSWVGAKRVDLIQEYNARLKTHRALEELRQEEKVLRTIDAWAQEIQREIFKFRDELLALQTSAQTQWQNGQAWNQVLWGHPYFNLEESVIDEADVETYYCEVASGSNDLKQHLAHLFPSEAESAHGFYRWLQQWLSRQTAADKMWLELYAYATSASKLLERHYIVEKLEEKFEKPIVRDMVEKTRTHAQPFLKTRIRGDLGEESSTPLLEVVAGHFESDKERHATEGAKVAQVLNDLQLLQEKAIDFGERHRLTFVTARRGMPLYVLPDVMQCYPSYRQTPERSLLHTTRGNLALPDISEDRLGLTREQGDLFDLEPRLTFALGLALSQFKWDKCQPKPTPFDTLTYQAGTADKPAGYYLTYIDKRQAEIALRLNRTPAKTVQLLGVSKAEACLTLYTNADLLDYLRRGIREYFEKVEYSQIAGELYDYIERGGSMTGTDVESGLEDWEAIELQGALDKLMGNMPPAQNPVPGPDGAEILAIAPSPAEAELIPAAAQTPIRPEAAEIFPAPAPSE